MNEHINLDVNFKPENTKYLNTVKDKQILMCSFEDVEYISNNRNQIINNSRSNNDNDRIISNIKPEIGKKRPVLVLKANKHLKTVVVIPLTTKKQDNRINKVYVPKNTLPGILSNKESWILCHLVSSVSIKRLSGIYKGDNSNNFVPLKESTINSVIFNNVQQVIKNFLNL